jgi:twitching motility two-component system response regulator PilH
MTILVVDDNADYRFLLDLALSLGGYTVLGAENGLDAIEVLEKHPVDLIISDIRMPRMDGIKLHAFARETPRLRYTKFIFISGFKEVYADVVVMDPVLDFFLDKTTPTEKILHLVDTLLKPDYAAPTVPQEQK